ncbi:unnamed protein product [Rhizophagus irregularis]|nr:unnamed protein product [Rhizophagus irregularis]
MTNRKRVTAVSYRASVISPEKGEQRPLDCDLTGLRFNIFLKRSKRNDNAKNRRMGLRKLHRNQSLDLPNQVETEYSDKNTHNRCANEKNEAFLSKLRELPDYLCEQLNKNNHWEFHQITEKTCWTLLDQNISIILMRNLILKCSTNIHRSFRICYLDI